VIGRIHALMARHNIALYELGAVYVVWRINVLMRLHRLSLGELLAAQRDVRITRCPSIDHDPRYQVAPGTQSVGAFMAEWHRLRADVE
jgi:hypothetical protein